MSEIFEHGLEEIRTDAARAHVAAGGFPTAPLVRRARRNRRTRAAAVTMVSAVAVVGVGLGAVTAADRFGESAVPPAGPQTVEVTPACGVALADLRILTGTDIELAGEFDASPLPADHARAVELWIFGHEAPTDAELVVLRDGEIVGLTHADLTPADDGPAVGQVRTLACAGTGADPLAPGDYDMVALLPYVVDGEAGYLSAGPWPFTVTDPGPDAEPPADPGLTDPDTDRFVDERSAIPGDPLEDGDYIAFVRGIDPVAGTIDVDLAVMYLGQAAVDWLNANDPDAENPPPNDHIIVNESEQVRTMTLAEGARIWDFCFDGPEFFVLRSLAEWAAAPEIGGLQCSEGRDLGRAYVYWLEVREGIVVQVVAQYVP